MAVRRWYDDVLEAEGLDAEGERDPSGLHIHPAWQLGAAVAGDVALRVRDRVLEVRCGEALLLPPLLAHESVKVEAPRRWMQLELTSQLWPELARRPRLLPPEPSATAITLIMESARGGPAAARLVALERLTAELRRLDLAPGEAVSGVAPAADLAGDPTQYGTVAELAATAGVHERTLLRKVQRHLGLSTKAWLVSQRVARALSLIDAGMSLPEVALSCGFADQSHLNRSFKRVTGVTPAAWRSRRNPAG